MVGQEGPLSGRVPAQSLELTVTCRLPPHQGVGAHHHDRKRDVGDGFEVVIQGRRERRALDFAAVAEEDQVIVDDDDLAGVAQPLQPVVDIEARKAAVRQRQLVVRWLGRGCCLLPPQPANMRAAV
jgi:hypothetical protein